MHRDAQAPSAAVMIRARWTRPNGRGPIASGRPSSISCGSGTPTARGARRTARHLSHNAQPARRGRSGRAAAHTAAASPCDARRRFAAEEKFSTVGCVCRDCHGNLAAAGSTGGLCNKQPGRVGDTPIVGAGVYACAPLCTAHHRPAPANTPIAGVHAPSCAAAFARRRRTPACALMFCLRMWVGRPWGQVRQLADLRYRVHGPRRDFLEKCRAPSAPPGCGRTHVRARTRVGSDCRTATANGMLVTRGT